MSRWWLVAAAILLVLPGNQERQEIGQLQPVELLQVYRQENLLYVETESGDYGVGSNAGEALEDLRRTIPGVVFLDTADYLLMSREAETELPQLQEILRPRTQVYTIRETVDGEEAAAYLRVHKVNTPLFRADALTAVPMLLQEEGRFRIAEENG